MLMMVLLPSRLLSLKSVVSRFHILYWGGSGPFHPFRLAIGPLVWHRTNQLQLAALQVHQRQVGGGLAMGMGSAIRWRRYRCTCLKIRQWVLHLSRFRSRPLGLASPSERCSKSTIISERVTVKVCGKQLFF